MNFSCGLAGMYTSNVNAGFSKPCSCHWERNYWATSVEFEYNCKRYFSHEGIEEDKQAERVMYNVDSLAICAWIWESKVEFKK